MSRGAAAAIALTVVTVGCGEEDRGARSQPEPRACTQIACRSGVTVVAPRRMPDDAAEIEACVARRCRTVSATARAAVFVPLARVRGPRAVRVRMRLLDSAGRPLATAVRRLRLERVQPNGPGCPPVCFAVRVRFPG